MSDFLEVLGTITEIEDIRSVWKHEAKDFSTWLAGNIDLLNQTLNLNLSIVQLEADSGDFSLDILAKEEETGEIAVIENQLEFSDHKHLGQLLTYASGQDAKYIIWIVKKAREEHRQAIDWLNQNTLDTFNFFLVEVKLLTIDNSKPAPYFVLASKPNNWAKQKKKQTSLELSENEQSKFKLWEGFLDYAQTTAYSLKPTQSPNINHWYSIAVGSSKYHINCQSAVTDNNKKIGIEFLIKDQNLYKKLESKIDKVQQELDCTFNNYRWRNSSGIIQLYGNLDYRKDDWKQIYDWYLRWINEFASVIPKFLK